MDGEGEGVSDIEGYNDTKLAHSEVPERSVALFRPGMRE